MYKTVNENYWLHTRGNHAQSRCFCRRYRHFAYTRARNVVVHDVQGSERPWEVGRKYPRSISIDRTKLVLTTPTYKAGQALPHDLLGRMQIPVDEELVNRLTFERIE
jgi:hypothetical protein